MDKMLKIQKPTTEIVWTGRERRGICDLGTRSENDEERLCAELGTMRFLRFARRTELGTMRFLRFANSSTTVRICEPCCQKELLEHCCRPFFSKKKTVILDVLSSASAFDAHGEEPRPPMDNTVPFPRMNE